MDRPFNFQLIRDLIAQLRPYVEDNVGWGQVESPFSRSSKILRRIITDYEKGKMRDVSYNILDLIENMPLNMFEKFEPVVVYSLQHIEDKFRNDRGFDAFDALRYVQCAREMYELTRFIVVTRLELRLNFKVELSQDIISNIENQMIESVKNHMKKKIMMFGENFDERIAELRAFPLQEVYAKDRGPGHETKRLLSGDRTATNLRIKLRLPNNLPYGAR